MPAAKQKLPPFNLRVRSPDRNSLSKNLQVWMDLINRIAKTKGIETIERREDTEPCPVDIYLKRDFADRARKTESLPMLYSLYVSSADERGAQILSTLDWPEFPRTTLH